MKSQKDGKLTFVKHGAGSRTFIILATCTPAGIWLATLAKVRVATLLADILIAIPFDSREICVTSLLRDKVLIKLKRVHSSKLISFCHAAKVATFSGTHKN